ncbi:diphthine--ammonia ligase-like [Bolinopsis microptera]|uniref:diphthine--ammonia ligase-like n=1 Tax=Bolinopsis microptera TaxID=2820187 RepID=UPI003078D424
MHKVVALVSGGKDSTYTIHQCVSAGHDVVALAHLKPPPNKEELDSYMYQSVGSNVVEFVSRALGVKLYEREISGTPVAQDLGYERTENDEVEDLYELLSEIKKETQITAVCSGAIFSTYQKNRVEEVCARLGLVSIAPLWEREQETLLQEMIDTQLQIRIIKVASIGLGKSHVGQQASDLLPHFSSINQKFGFNVCGEGGEYESLVTDCPLFGYTIQIDSSEKVCHSHDDMAPVWYEKFENVSLVEKPMLEKMNLRERLDLYVDGVRGNLPVLSH